MPRNSVANDAQASTSVASMPTYESARISTVPSLSDAALSVLVDGLARKEATDQVVVLLGVLPLRPVRRIGHARELRTWDRGRDPAPHIRPGPRVVVGPQHQRRRGHVRQALLADLLARLADPAEGMLEDGPQAGLHPQVGIDRHADVDELVG